MAEGKPGDARLQIRGEPGRLGDIVPRSFPEVLGGQMLSGDDAKTSGRRQLAEWLTDRNNPLTPRVMANRIWQYHFGAGLVKTPSDFGTRGTPPTHPELLDWLASRFMEQGWSLNQMHRLIMLSRTYQLASSAPGEEVNAVKVDPASLLPAMRAAPPGRRARPPSAASRSSARHRRKTFRKSCGRPRVRP
jgi:hypothetical protein